MANARQHAEWMSLVEVSGPFLTLSVLDSMLKNGLDAHDPDLYRTVKEAYGEWEETHDPAIHTMWGRFLLQTALGYPEEVIVEGQAIPDSLSYTKEDHGERVSPTLVVIDPESAKPILPLLIVPRGQKLDAPLAGSRWPASPHTRMQLLLQNTGLQAGFVSNGAQWSLVHVRKGEPTGVATWQTVLLTEEPITLRAFRDVLGVTRTLGAPEGETLFDMLDKSAVDAEEVTKELGRQVRQAVEVFVNALERLDRASGRELLGGATTEEVYAAALTTMMRLVFMLCAEERDLFELGDIWERHYAVSSLNDQLKEEKDETVLEHRHDAWRRLLATFRLVHGGSSHEDLRIPAYGGSLFDPTRYPFLEAANVDNRTVLHLLDALEYLEVRLPGGGRETRRISFRALGVEQIGHVYEGLLDHTAKRASEATIGLVGKETEEPEVALSELEAKFAESDAALATHLASLKVSSSRQCLKWLAEQPSLERQRDLQVACAGDDDLYIRLLPFANLVRADSLGHLQVFPKGAVYMTAGDDRRSTGTHYTPVTLTEEVVQYALEPLVYVGPAEGKPRSEWVLRTAKEVVDLKVCDMAMGSGAFLVQACRYLAERLVEAWQIALDKAGRVLGFSAEGHYFTHELPSDQKVAGGRTLISTPMGSVAVADPGQELIPTEAEERLAVARRIVADRCLYGVDKNPMAVEMAKLSLWLTTLRRDRPFTFLDHALRHGDSLLGVNERQLAAMTVRPDEDTGTLLLHWVPEKLEKVKALRQQIARIPSHDPESVRRKIQLHLGVRVHERWLSEAGDVLLLGELSRLAKTPLPQRKWDDLVHHLQQGPYKLEEEQEELRIARALLGRPVFNWHLEFPDVFERGGFDVIVGNPPFCGGKMITGVLGTDYRDFLVNQVGGGKRGSADLCAYFFLQAYGLLRDGGTLGLLATNTISQGDTREVGLDQLTESGGTIYRADKSTKWPGDANLEIAKVWARKAQWSGDRILEGEAAPQITSFLDDGAASGKPFRLRASQGKSFQGSVVLGMGFVLTADEAQALILNDPRNKDVLFPYLNGEDLNSRPDQSPSRWVINFFDWPLGRTSQRLPHSGELVADAILEARSKRSEVALPSPRTLWKSADDEQKRKWLQVGVVPDDYIGPVAADYLQCLSVVEQAVRPQRATVNRDKYREKWWQFAEPCLNMYLAIQMNRRCLACSLVSQYLGIAWYEPNIVFSHRLAVFPLPLDGHFGLLQSTIHEVWARNYSSTLESRLNYSPTDCFETFPFPPLSEAMDGAGASLATRRENACQHLDVGLTDLAKMIHDPRCEHPAITDLREHIVATDLAVRDAYDWGDLDLGHGFHGDGKARRFTISPAARQEVLRRLLKLNHQRHAEEVAAGLHDTKKGTHGKRKTMPTRAVADRLSTPLANLFDDQMVLGEVDA